jgi:uncharacterized membrane protein
MSWWNDGDFEFSKEVDVNVDMEISLEFETEVEVKKDVDVNVDVDVKVDIDGNYADFNIDIQAVGDDSATELNLVVLVTDDYSSITATGFAAVG